MTIRRILAVLLLVLVVSCRKRTAKVKVTELTLPNGLQVELVPGRCGEGTTVGLLFAVGSDADPPGRSGMSHVVERVLGHRSRTVNAGADHVAYATAATTARLSDQLDTMAAELRALDVDEMELAKAELEVFADLEERHGGDATRTAMSYAAESVQPTPGDGWRGGIQHEVDTMALADLDAFWQAHFKAGHARLTVIGTFDAAAIQRRIEAAFADVPAGSPPVPRPPVVASVTGTLTMGSAPTAVAIAVPLPKPDRPLYPAVLILAARSTSGEYQLDYDPITQPETLFVVGAIQPDERPEAAAARIRAGLDALLARPLEAGDRAAAKARFPLLLTGRELDSALCAKDPRAYLIARLRRAQLQLDGPALARAIDATTPAQLAEAAALFDAKRTAAVIAGGLIR